MLGIGHTVQAFVFQAESAGKSAVTDVSPGNVGFLATAGVVVATILLMLNMTKRIRRIDHNHRQEQEKVAAARKEQETQKSDAAED